MFAFLSFFGLFLARSKTVDQAVRGLSSAVATLESVRDSTRDTAIKHAERAATLAAKATQAHDEADRAHRVASQIKALIA